MAKIYVVAEDNPNVMIQISETGDLDGGVDGACSWPGCDYTVSEGGTWHGSFEDMVQAAECHVDRPHD